MGLLDFHSAYKIAFVVHLKCSSFWPSGDVKPMSNYLVQVMPWQYMFCSLYLYFVNTAESLVNIGPILSNSSQTEQIPAQSLSVISGFLNNSLRIANDNLSFVNISPSIAIPAKAQQIPAQSQQLSAKEKNRKRKNRKR